MNKKRYFLQYAMMTIVVMICVACIANYGTVSSQESKAPGATIAISSPTFVRQAPTSPTTSVPPSPTPNLTWTPIPTLVQDQKEDVLREWMKADVECIFPCWADITPGETTWVDATNNLQGVLDIYVVPTPVSASCEFGDCDGSLGWQQKMDGYLHSGQIYSQENIIYSIYLNGEEYFPEYTPQKMFLVYGEPAEVLIYANQYTIDNKPILMLIMLYPDAKFVVRFMWWAKLQENNIIACGTPYLYGIEIAAIEGANFWSYPLVTERLESIPLDDANYRHLSSVTGLSTTEFYKAGLVTDEPFCISTSIEHWQ